MDVSVNKLSSCSPRTYSSNINTLNKYQRYYDGGFSFNFYDAFADIRDVKFKNYSSFYLTKNFKLTDIVSSETNPIKSDDILTTLNFGGSFLTFSPRDFGVLRFTENEEYSKYDQYGDYGFTTDKNSASNFIIEIGQDNTCKVYFLYQYKKYYLGVDNNRISFFGNKLGISPIVFNYIYSSTNNSISLFENSNSTCKMLTKSGNSLNLTPFSEFNKVLAVTNTIYIDRPLYSKVEDMTNFSIVGYDTDNTIPNNLIEKNIENNYLIHSENDEVELLVLKNQLTQNDTFTSGNNLLSTSGSPFFIDKMRDYTSIFNDITKEKDEELTLNYVFYNKSYVIKSGKNYLKAPSSLSPFLKININDTKFVECGAFSFDTPIYSDKVYKLDDDNLYSDGQVYLCTWLSGSPLGDEKIWVDRYYYPDFIEKEQALKLKATFNPTYEDLVENLVKNDAFIRDSLSAFQVFDKKSDFIIEPNDKFVYERIGNFDPILTDDRIDLCDEDNLNYFEKINDAGEFTLLLNFKGDSSNWIFKSNRNNIEAGLEIIKNGNFVELTYILFDPSDNTYNRFNTIQPIRVLKDNHIVFSINVMKGIAYANLNGKIVLNINFDKYQFFGKKVLFGNFIANFNNENNFSLYLKSTTFNESLILPFVNDNARVDKIEITLPCGQRNNDDEIDLLQSVCNNQSFKSNHINILIRNTTLPESIKSDLERIIRKTCDDFTPVTTELNNIIYFK